MIGHSWQRWLGQWLGRSFAARAHTRSAYRPRVEPLERRDLLSFTAVSFPTSAASTAVVAGDFNHDGKLDIALLHAGDGTSPGSIGILLGNGNGTFQAEHTYATGVAPSTLIGVDLNRDGNLDLVENGAGPGSSSAIGVLLGNGDGSFRDRQTYAVGRGPAAVAAGDFNGDGKPDLVVANSSSGGPSPFSGNTISLLLGTGDGTFQNQQTFLTGKGPDGVAVGDFNGDGKLDVAVSNSADNSVSLLLGNGNGTFAGQQTSAAGTSPAGIAAADFNGDGKLDLAVGGAKGALLLGTGDGTFAGQQPLPIGASFAVGDVTHDGKPDLAEGAEAWFNTGGGTFRNVAPLVSSTVQSGQIIPALPQGSFTSNAIGDLNGDGTPDLVLGNALDFANHNFVVLFSHPDSPHFLVTASGYNPRFPGQAVSVTVTALDAYGNIETDYTGSVTLSSTDRAAALPTAYAFTPADHGTHTFSVTLNTNGNQSITATDALGAMTGSVGMIDVQGNPGSTVVGFAEPAFGGVTSVTHLVAVGAAAGSSPVVEVYDADTKALKFSIMAYDPRFTGGVRVAFDDSRLLLFTAPGPGGGPDIHVYNVLTGALVGQFWAFDPNFTGGCFVATGDVNNDGYKDVIVGADAGGGPQVSAFSGGAGFSLITSFFAYDPHFTGGVRVATSRLSLANGIGRPSPGGGADIICGAGPGGGPDVAVYKGDGTLLSSFLAFDPHFTGGVYVAANDVAENINPYIVVSAGAGGGPDVAIYNATDLSLVDNFFVTAPSFTGGVPVALVQQNNALIEPPAIITGPSVNNGQVELIDALSGTTVDSFMAQSQGGMYVAATLAS